MAVQPRLMVVMVAACVGLAACDNNPSGVHDGRRVTLAFSTVPAAAASAVVNLRSGGADELVLAGTNGTLTITDIHFLVNDLELEKVEAACEQEDGEHDVAADQHGDCEEFESNGVSFIDLPLSGSGTHVVTQQVPAGTYTHLKFEVEDVELDEADEAEAGDLAAVRQLISAAGFTNWPDNASMVVVGTFTPTGGAPRPFTAYFEAEIDVKMDFDPPLVVGDQGGTVDIEVDPSAWFADGHGGVIDLSQFDYATHHQVVEFEAKARNGFHKIELEGFDD